MCGFERTDYIDHVYTVKLSADVYGSSRLLLVLPATEDVLLWLLFVILQVNPRQTKQLA